MNVFLVWRHLAGAKAQALLWRICGTTEQLAEKVDVSTEPFSSG
jgi:hypothetical protein